MFSQSAASTILRPCTIAPSFFVLGPPCKNLASGAFDDLVLGVIFEASQRYMLRLAVLLLWGNDCVDAFVFEKLIVLAVSITAIACESLDLLVSVVFNALYLLGKLTAFALFAGGDIHIDNHTTAIVNSGMLLIAGLHTERIARCCQRRIRIGFAAFLGLWRLRTRPARTLGVVAIVIVLLDDRFGVLCGHAFPTDICTDKSGIYMNCFAVKAPVPEAEKQRIAGRLAAGYGLGPFRSSLEMKENADFFLTPALLVQEAICEDIIITYPTE